ncbi:baseplate hub [Pseudomonas phage PspYZU05]|uniref:Baseplate hub subunit n=1 Tax=Pseudomonas phage PspYZU05 TaxID=1983556 RepID=A0A2U7N8C9_9CAUD|nr:baseplate hub [Pseudomonas phage PspYZU05]ASD52103.1 baseplate hub subunit [Pseudomonas phage PspYZU05]
MNQRPGFPNISIKLFQNYDAWLENRYLELGATFTTLTLRDGIHGTNEGILQFYDAKNLHTRLTGNEFIHISLRSQNDKSGVRSRLFGIAHSSVSVDKKSDNIIAFNLTPIHHSSNLGFNRSFFHDAGDSIKEMIDFLYNDSPHLKPKVNTVKTFVPVFPWTKTLSEYLQYSREIGLSVQNDDFVFIWEDWEGIHIEDYSSIIDKEPETVAIGDPSTIGQMVQEIGVKFGFDFEWLTKSNRFVRDPLKNVTAYTQSMYDNQVTRIIAGEGNNVMSLSRSGAYSEMTYRNGFEEARHLGTTAQFDSYAKFKTFGDFDIMPGQRLIFTDPKQQYNYTFVVDEVIHEIANNTSITTVYMFANSTILNDINPIKVKNELKVNSAN